MNVSSSTATSSTTSTTSSSTATATKTQEKGAASFDEEMKKADNAEVAEQEVQQNPDEAKAQEKNDSASDEKQNSSENDNNMLTGKLEVDLDSDVKLNSADLLSLNIQQLLDTQNQINNKTEVFQVSISRTEDLTKNIGETLNLEMNMDDAQFFMDVVKNNNAGVQNVVQDVQQAMTFGTEKVQKSANVSQTLINALSNSAKTGQAVRIDFGNDVAVVMRVNRDGSIMANFIPGDKAVEEYLKNNIGFLKQRFDEEDIPYSQLSYSQHQQQERRQQQENNKENKHE